MLPRRKNLLEAFKKSDAAGAASASGPSSGLPLSQTPAPPPRAAPGPLFEGTGARSAGVGRQPAPALIGIGLVFAFVAGFLVGRGTEGEAQAEESEQSTAGLVTDPAPRRGPPATQPRAFQERPNGAEAAESAPAQSQRLEDSELFDVANTWTVVVAAYSNTNQDLAWATFEHLRDLGLPVFPPVASKNLILVVVGAAPTSGELAKTESTVQALTRDGKKPYETAYRGRIDALIPRTPK